MEIFPVIGDFVDPQMLTSIGIDEAFLDLEGRIARLIRAQCRHEKAERTLRVFHRSFHRLIGIRDLHVARMYGRFRTASCEVRSFLFCCRKADRQGK